MGEAAPLVAREAAPLAAPGSLRRAVTSLAPALRFAAASLAAPAGTLDVPAGISRVGATCLAPVCGSKAAPLSSC